MIKNSFFLPLMAAAVGGPFLFFAGENESDSDSSSEQVVSEIELTGFEPSQKKIYEPAGELTELFDFNLTPQAVENRFRDATRSSVNGKQIFRTSVLSGHGATDPVGALTYHFSSAGRLSTIQFSGFVNDPSRLTSFVSSKFGFVQADDSGSQFRPSTFSGHTGELKLAKSREFGAQFKVELHISR